MAEEEEEEEVEVAKTASELLSEFAVIKEDGSTDPFYVLGCFSFPEEEPTSHVPIILITGVLGSFLVGVPLKAWHKKRAQRTLVPPDLLTKPVAVAVAAVPGLDRETVGSESVKVWLGLLNSKYQTCLSFDEAAPTEFSCRFLTDGGSDAYVPFSEGLVAAADEKFCFLSAESHAAEEPETTQQRLAKLEEHIVSIKSALDSLTRDPKEPARASTARVATGAKAKVKASPADGGYPGLDPAVVKSALAAGIEGEHLTEFSRLIQSQKPKLPDVPADRKKPPPKLDILGESEEEVENEADVGAAEVEASNPMEKAVLQLASIVGSLASRKKGRNFEELLDDTAVSQDNYSSGSVGGGQRRHAMLYRNLKKALREAPEEIYRIIEQRMEADFGSQELGPGMLKQSGTFRAWAEHRSRIPNLNASVRTAWAVAGALDALRADRPKEAQARLALFLCQLDQVAVDRGQWLLAAEGGLEDSLPPFSNFSRHSPPDYQEPQLTKLWPPAWGDSFMHRVRELDEFVERRQKLGKRNALKLEEVDRKGSGKGKKGKGGSGEAPPPNQ